MIRLKAFRVQEDGDQSKVVITVDGDDGVKSEHEYVGTVTTGVSFRNQGSLHLEVTVTPSPLKRDNLSNKRFGN